MTVVVHETAPSKQLGQLISVDLGEGAALKILEHVIGAMLEGSDHKALMKTLVEQFFANHPDIAGRRQRRLEHNRNDENNARR